MVEAYRGHLAVVGGVVLQQLVGPRIPHLDTRKRKQETRGDNTAVCMSTKIYLRTFRRHNLFRGKTQQVGHSGP